MTLEMREAKASRNVSDRRRVIVYIDQLHIMWCCKYPPPSRCQTNASIVLANYLGMLPLKYPVRPCSSRSHFIRIMGSLFPNQDVCFFIGPAALHGLHRRWRCESSWLIFSGSALLPSRWLSTFIFLGSSSPIIIGIPRWMGRVLVARWDM